MYLLFAGDDYQPNGGWADYRGQYSTSDEAVLTAANLSDIDWWHVVAFGTAPKIIVRGKRG